MFLVLDIILSLNKKFWLFFIIPKCDTSVALYLHSPLTFLYSVILTPSPGLEEFEEKIDKIAEGEDDGESSWISKIYNQFSFFNDDDVENSLDENDMDSLEPPLLDETWGLGVRNTSRGEDIFG